MGWWWRRVHHTRATETHPTAKSAVRASSEVEPRRPKHAKMSLGGCFAILSHAAARASAAAACDCKVRYLGTDPELLLVATPFPFTEATVIHSIYLEPPVLSWTSRALTFTGMQVVNSRGILSTAEWSRVRCQPVWNTRLMPRGAPTVFLEPGCAGAEWGSMPARSQHHRTRQDDKARNSLKPSA